MILVEPSLQYLPSYIAALQRGWNPDNTRDVRFEELRRIREDPQTFLALLDNPEGRDPLYQMPDGSFVPRLPGFHRWMWDGEFAGDIGIRWQPGTAELPPQCLGHIGYSVVPWKRGRGYAKAALALMLAEARTCGLPYVKITTDLGNLASQRVILANGGVLVERFHKGPAYGDREALRYRITV